MPARAKLCNFPVSGRGSAGHAANISGRSRDDAQRLHGADHRGRDAVRGVFRVVDSLIAPITELRTGCFTVSVKWPVDGLERRVASPRRRSRETASLQIAADKRRRTNWSIHQSSWAQGRSAIRRAEERSSRGCQQTYADLPLAEPVNKCRSELCRNCVRSPRNRRQTSTFTGSHREAFCGGKSLNRLRDEMFRCHSVQLAGFVFQACSFNHSDISPL